MLSICSLLVSCNKDENEPSPIIVDFNPKSGVVGTEITITGDNYSSNISENVIMFGVVKGEVKSATKTQIIVDLPEGATTGKIKLVSKGKKVNSEADFVVIMPPTFQSFSPINGRTGDTLVITGTNFGNSITDLFVRISGQTSSIIQVSPNQVKVVVPGGVSPGKISIAKSGYLVESLEDFTIIPPPEITGLSSLTGGIGNSINILGINFGIPAYKNTVTVNGIAVQHVYLHYSDMNLIDGISIVLPEGVTNGKIQIKVGPYTVISDQEITILPGMRKQLTSSGGASGYYATGWSIGTMGYQAFGVDNNQNGLVEVVKDVYAYNSLTGQWKKKNDFPSTARQGVTAFTLGNKAYIVGGHSGQLEAYLKEVWQYSPDTDTWIRKNDFPAIVSSAVSFVINNKAYVGTGSTDVITQSKKFWTYDEVNDNWNSISDLPGDARYNAVAFVLDNTAYVGTGRKYGELGFGVMNDMWAYNPISNQWSQIASLPSDQNRYGATAFALNGKGYIMGGNNYPATTFLEGWGYDPAGNNWGRIIDGGYEGNAYFSIGLKGYYGLSSYFFSFEIK